MINIETYEIGKDNYVQEVFSKYQIILAESLRIDHNHLIRLKNKELGKATSWPAFTITRTGEVYQHYDPKYFSRFIGIDEIDKYAVPIVLENMGKLFFEDESSCYVNWCNEVCHNDRVYHRDFKEYCYWENYTPEQMDALVGLCKALCAQFNIVNDCIGFNFYNEETKYFKGIVCRSNYSYDFCDLSPAFHWKEFMDKMEISLID